MARIILSTNLATGMFSVIGISGGTFEMEKVTLESIRGIKGINALNNQGVQSWLKQNGVDLEGQGNTKFQLFGGDVLYLITDPPGQKDDVILSYKEKDFLPPTIHPIIIKILVKDKVEG